MSEDYGMLLRKFESIEKLDNGYLIKGDTASVKLIFLTDDVIRIRVSFDGIFRESAFLLLQRQQVYSLQGSIWSISPTR